MSDPVDIRAIEQELDELFKKASEALASARQEAELEEVRVSTLGRKGKLSAYFEQLRSKTLSVQDKARLGQKLNTVKRHLESQLKERQAGLKKTPQQAPGVPDLSLPGRRPSFGQLHPITQTISQVVDIFRNFGFSVVEGPEVESEHHNFEALNIPPEHPSREENFDTLYLDPATAPARGSDNRSPALLRTHTSPVQIRFMEKHQPPFQIICPGRVFRRDAVDATHCFQFHQLEGLVVGPGLTFGDLKGLLVAWARQMFGEDTELRFRPHHFPFTEPSAEVDLRWGRGKKKWLEILGCGMVHPAVFRVVDYVPGTVGFAFGMGIERIAMLKYGIDDIRLFFENDVRFLRQFP